MSSSPSIPIPVRRGSHSAASSPCSLDSGSDASSDAWAPAGVYVPIQKRSLSYGSSSRASIASSSSPTSAPPSPRDLKASLPDKTNPADRPYPIYSRDELLALAPTAFVHNILRPVVTPALVAQHPKCLRLHGEGIARARALEMVNLPSYSLHLPARPLTPQERNYDAGHNRGRKSKRPQTSGQPQLQPQGQGFKVGQHQENQKLKTSQTMFSSGRRRSRKVNGNSGFYKGSSLMSTSADAARLWREPHVTTVGPR
ncbi:hypothetical protein EW145_g352 [Phellinidium pouzarii]|uniref:Uncharacterized protein n=1 Tax=Phellinidium pouzarii TaxID=167371 RepID=A0A4S4LJE1_9AGAM|nr:hypothetical protein EW145_g352 [Phellinidium pouzarii]